MRAMEESGGLLDGIHAVAHPESYWICRHLANTAFTTLPDTRRAQSLWPSVLTHFQVIANRQTLIHRDVTGPGRSFDMLLTMGTYGRKAVMELRNLGVSVPYDAGSMVVLASRIISHGVPRVPPDRICYAMYQHEQVLKWFGVQGPSHFPSLQHRRGEE